jgi:S-adenosylmethionine uptake transporter
MARGLFPGVIPAAIENGVAERRKIMKATTAYAVGGNAILAGILLMLLGDLMFALNDAMGKWLVASFSVGQVLLLRSLGAFLVLGPLLARSSTTSLFKVEKPGLQFARVVMATADTGLFYAAVVYLPLADVMTFYMAGPIYVAAISHFFLGERIGWRRWAARWARTGPVACRRWRSIAMAGSTTPTPARRTRWAATTTAPCDCRRCMRTAASAR